MLKYERHCLIALQKLSWLVFITTYSEVDSPGGSDCKESTCNAWQPTPVFLPGESPWTEEPGGIQSMGSQRVGHNWATEHTHRQCYLHFLGEDTVFRKWNNLPINLTSQKELFSFLTFIPFTFPFLSWFQGSPFVWENMMVTTSFLHGYWHSS